MLLTSVSVNENLSVTIQMEATKQYFPMVLLKYGFKVFSNLTLCG